MTLQLATQSIVLVSLIFVKPYSALICNLMHVHFCCCQPAAFVENSTKWSKGIVNIPEFFTIQLHVCNVGNDSKS